MLAFQRWVVMSVMNFYVFNGFCRRTRPLSNMAPRKQAIFLIGKAKKRRAQEKRTGAAELFREELQAPIGVDSDSDAATLAARGGNRAALVSWRDLTASQRWPQHMWEEEREDFPSLAG